ncbi:hypothetical protein P170DRAFT_347203 [Aspergillus steynii IBT 23096]|uniref:ER membrane protein complex subunit 2 n=1 Tax=Aspergillus steynii IBT 23096 TaxID=1392250 RepID=A0A2I2GN46_9EURO|nr:uncharacterized protein P170DRAFT_347203 [Aspergillus steynii IBT 23096]PLB54307.1 hypothetical protein P170DRAFT_347203 [Aspergillus steynii IBT 23096]
MADPASEMHNTHSPSLIATLHFAQQAPVILNRQAHLGKKPLLSLISKKETFDDYGAIEQLFFSCLQSGDDKSALLCLDQLTLRFGSSNERVMGLLGLYEEAVAENKPSLDACLQKYDHLLSENPVNLPILKRRIAVLRSLDRPALAIASLIDFLKAVPTDAEAWCELAELYQSQGLSAQAIFSLEEALLIAPNAWNIHARLGELLYIDASSSPPEISTRGLYRSMQYFCRSIELCQDYLRGFYGLTLVTSDLIGKGSPKDNPADAQPIPVEDSPPSKDTVERLNAFAKRGLEAIISKRPMDHSLWEHAQGELIAAKELISRMPDYS